MSKVYAVANDRDTISILDQLCEKRPEDYELINAGPFNKMYLVNADSIHWKPGIETGVIE